MTDSKPTEPLEMLDNTAMFIESMTGIKAQFVAAGWRDYTAELMCVEMFRKLEPATR